MVMAAHSPASIINKFGLTPLGAYQPSSQKISPERLLSRRGDDLFRYEVPDSQPAQAIVRRGYALHRKAVFRAVSDFCREISSLRGGYLPLTEIPRSSYLEARSEGSRVMEILCTSRAESPFSILSTLTAISRNSSLGRKRDAGQTL